MENKKAQAFKSLLGIPAQSGRIVSTANPMLIGLVLFKSAC
jgi:hypothetical protein